MAKVCFLSADLFHKKCNTGARMAKSMAKVCGKKTDLRQKCMVGWLKLSIFADYGTADFGK